MAFALVLPTNQTSKCNSLGLQPGHTKCNGNGHVYILAGRRPESGPSSSLPSFPEGQCTSDLRIESVGGGSVNYHG